MITIATILKSDLSKAWNYYTLPEHIMRWNFASDDWHCPAAVNDLVVGGSFRYTMASRDGKYSFEFDGTYDEILPLKKIAYTLGDGRKVEVLFESHLEGVRVTLVFDPEAENSLELQKNGWQAILDNYKKLTEG